MTEEAQALKKSYREKTLDKMKNMTEEKRNEDEASLFEQVQALIAENNYSKIGVYYGVHPEVDTPALVEQLSDLEVYLPRMMPKRVLSFRRFTSEEDLETVWGNILQPKEESEAIDKHDLDLIIVPGVAFRPDGYRIGFGGGYYDRFLSDLKVPTVSLIFNEQLYDAGEWEPDSYDIAVETVITPK